jgi:hypothetical protein
VLTVTVELAGEPATTVEGEDAVKENTDAVTLMVALPLPEA